MTINESKRNSNIELLRILSIILIVVGHAFRHGIISQNNMIESNDIMSIVSYVFSSGGGIANRLFIIITGYYSYKSSSFKLKKFSDLIAIDHVYSFVICLIVYGFGISSLSWKMVIESIFPVWFGLNWFITCFLILLIIIPLINVGLQNIELKTLTRIVIALLFVRYIASILCAKTFMSVGNTFEEFFIMYIVGGLLAKGKNVYIYSKYINLFLYIGIIGLVIFDSLSFFAIKHGLSIIGTDPTYFHDIFNPMIAVGLFVVFIKRRENHNQIISNCAKGVLGVYLIHDNPIVRPMLWNNSLVGSISNYDIYPVFIILYAIVVVVSCFIIDLLLRITFHSVISAFSRFVQRVLVRFSILSSDNEKT